MCLLNIAHKKQVERVKIRQNVNLYSAKCTSSTLERTKNSFHDFHLEAQSIYDESSAALPSRVNTDCIRALTCVSVSNIIFNSLF
jgi:hypothetical protein